MRLSDTPKPDFTDHFPRTAPGHGMAGLLTYKIGDVTYQTKAKRCVEPRCQLNVPSGRAGGEKHACGSADNAGAYMRAVSYNGPDPGVTREKEREVREDRTLSPHAKCHDRC